MKMTQEQLEIEKRKIDAMTQLEMARLHRFAPVGHKYFVRGELNDYFNSKFKGMTTKLSKTLGWDNR